MSEDLAAEFRRFAEEDCTGRVGSPSPLYERLSLEIAEDSELLELADEAREEQPTPMVLLAAVQYLLFENPAHRLAAYYPSVDSETSSVDGETTQVDGETSSVDSETRPVDDGTSPAFREFCDEHEAEIRELISSRRVQTNTVRRSGCLLPAIEYVSRAVDRAPLGLVEIGSSAGLNLLWDQYGYSYDGMQVGDDESAVQIDCELRGEIEPPLPTEMPPVGSRRGIDLYSLAVDNDDDSQWLDALIWPEHETRRDNVRHAAEIAAADPPTIHEGDVLEELETVVDSVPDDQPICLYNSYVLYQLSDSQRADLYDLVDELGAKRDIYWLSCEWAMDVAIPMIHCYRWEDGVHSGDLLARFHGHGAWLQWLQRR
jgi:hypothetical protein